MQENPPDSPDVARFRQKARSLSASGVAPPLVNNVTEGNLREKDGNSRPRRSRETLFGRSRDRTSSSSSTDYEHSTELNKVMPDDDTPDVSPRSRLIRSSSFTKLHPGLPKEMIPHITSESSDYSLNVDTSLDTSLLMKDTNEVSGRLLVIFVWK